MLIFWNKCTFAATIKASLTYMNSIFCKVQHETGSQHKNGDNSLPVALLAQILLTFSQSDSVVGGTLKGTIILMSIHEIKC